MIRRLSLFVAIVLVALAPTIPGQALEPRSPREPRKPRTPGSLDVRTPDASPTRTPRQQTTTQRSTAPTTTQAPAPTGAAGVHSSVESRLLSLINSGRASVGRGPLAPHSGLRAVARQHSQHQARIGNLTHAGFRSRIDQGMPGWSAACENVARFRPAGGAAVSNATVAATMYRLWHESLSHRRCMLDARGAGYRFAGVGVYRDSIGGWWATLELAR